MKKWFIALVFTLFALSIALLFVYIHNHSIPVLHPKGQIAIEQRDLIAIAFLLMCIVVIPAYLLTFVFAWKYHDKNKKSKYTPDWAHSTLGETIWWGVPCVIIAILAVITWESSHKLDPFKPLQSDVKPLRIQVVALQWKWLFIYPDVGIATVGYLQFPEKTPLNFEITADAPMNSFWIPGLGGQIYAMPAMRTELHLIANETGTFRGSSANLSGDGFAGMMFAATAVAEEDFQAWVQEVQQSGNRLSSEEYFRLKAPSAYLPKMDYASVEENLFDHILMQYMQGS